MEWSREKTKRLVELLQLNTSLWNPAVCDSRRDKQRRKEELRRIGKVLEISVGNVTKKIQHLRTQYNREAAREARFKIKNPTENYVSNWYAFEYLHFLKDPSKPFRMLSSSELSSEEQLSSLMSADSGPISKSGSPPSKFSRLDTALAHEQDRKSRDQFSVFGEYVANELRSLSGEKYLLLAKKKIQDAIYAVKMDSMNQELEEELPSPLQSSNAQSPTSSMSDISSIINNCHYIAFKVDQP